MKRWSVAFSISFISLVMCPSLLIQAQTDNNVVGKSIPSAQSQTQRPVSQKRWALVIGVDRYDRTGVSLRAPAKDAKLLADTLIRVAQFDEDHVIVLTPDQPLERRRPTKRNITFWMRYILPKIPPDGLFLFCFGGHGMERDGHTFLLPSDTELDSDEEALKESALSWKKLTEWVNEYQISKVVALLDACRDEPTSDQSISKRDVKLRGMNEAYTLGVNLDAANRGVRGAVTLFATQQGRVSYEKNGKGFFTQAVIEALNGEAANDKGEVTLRGLIEYVKTRVPRIAQVEGRDQQPFDIIEGSESLGLILAFSAVPDAAKVNTPPAVVEAELAALNEWRKIKSSTDPEVFKAYRKRYPTSDFAELAYSRLKVLGVETEATSSSPAKNNSRPPSSKPSDAQAGVVSPVISESTKSLDKAGSEGYQQAKGLNEQADLHYAQGRYTQAEPLYRQALAIQEKALGTDHIETARTREKLTELLLSTGEAKIKRGDYGDAIADFTKGLEFDGKNAVFYGYRGVAQARKGDLDAAVADLSQAVNLNPRLLGAYYNRASVKLLKGDYSGAIADLTKEIELNPKAAPAYVARAVAYSKNSQTREAQQDYDTARQLDPNIELPSSPGTNASAPSPVAYLASGIEKACTGDHKGAIDDYTRAIQVKRNGIFYKLRGFSRERQGDYTGGLVDYLSGEKLDSTNKSDYEQVITGLTGVINAGVKNVHAVLLRGFIKFNIGDFDGAIADFAQVTTAESSKDAKHTAYVYRAVAKANKGDLDGGLADLESAHKFVSNPAWASLVRAGVRSGSMFLAKGFADDPMLRSDMQNVYLFNTKLYNVIGGIMRDRVNRDLLFAFFYPMGVPFKKK